MHCLDEHTTGTIVCITNGAQCPSNSEVATTMNVGLIKAWHIFYSPRKCSVVNCSQDSIYKTLLSKTVHDRRDEVARKAGRRRWHVDEKLIWCEGSILHTTASSASREIERVCGTVGLEIGSIAAKPCLWIEDRTREDGRAASIV